MIIQAGETERIEKRIKNRELILAALDMDSAGPEGCSMVDQMMAQQSLRIAMQCIRTLYQYACTDMEPDTEQSRITKALLKQYYGKYLTATETDFDFVAARPHLIAAVKLADAEQCYHLHLLLQFDVPSIRDTGLFRVASTDYLLFLQGKSRDPKFIAKPIGGEL